MEKNIFFHFTIIMIKVVVVTLQKYKENFGQRTFLDAVTPPPPFSLEFFFK